MEPTDHDAEAMLKGAGDVGTAVQARVPQEPPLYVAMGLTILLFGMSIDLLAAGPVLGLVGMALVVAAVAVTVGANLPYLRRWRQVRTRRATPMWLEWMLGLWSGVALFGIGIPLADTIGFSHTLGGIVGAVPILLWALRLRRAA